MATQDQYKQQLIDFIISTHPKEEWADLQKELQNVPIEVLKPIAQSSQKAINEGNLQPVPAPSIQPMQGSQDNSLETPIPIQSTIDRIVASQRQKNTTQSEVPDVAPPLHTPEQRRAKIESLTGELESLDTAASEYDRRKAAYMAGAPLIVEDGTVGAAEQAYIDRSSRKQSTVMPVSGEPAGPSEQEYTQRSLEAGLNEVPAEEAKSKIKAAGVEAAEKMRLKVGDSLVNNPDAWNRQAESNNRRLEAMRRSEGKIKEGESVKEAADARATASTQKGYKLTERLTKKGQAALRDEMSKGTLNAESLKELTLDDIDELNTKSIDTENQPDTSALKTTDDSTLETTDDYSPETIKEWAEGQKSSQLPHFKPNDFGGLGGSVNRIMVANSDRFKGKSADLIYTGETLKIPDGKGGLKEHVVKKGETVSELAGYKVAAKKKAATTSNDGIDKSALANAILESKLQRGGRQGEGGYRIGGRFVADNDPTQKSFLTAARKRIEENL